jgi:ribonuclease D
MARRPQIGHLPTPPPETAPPGPHLVTDPEGLAQVIRRLQQADRYALDTEFHRERTYWPRLALVQVAWPAQLEERPAGVALIDPQAVDITSLGEVLAGPGTMVAHAAEQDLEVLEQACGRGPERLFDTQVAAGFSGHSSASLATLARTYLSVEIAKGDRLTDWSKRPLTASQLAYAASDVAHLLALADSIGKDLAAVGRLAWAEDECEVVRTRAHGPGRPTRAWWKMRDARQLRGVARGIAQEVAAWRERRAQAVDVPVRSVLPDLAMQSIAQHPPATESALSQVRGLDARHLRAGAAADLLAAIARGRQLNPDQLELPPSDEVARELRPAVALAMAWVAQLAKDSQVDAALLATRQDIVDYLRGDPAARLGRGWRAAMVGEPLRHLVDGQAALAFGPAGRLLLEARSHRRWNGEP